ncbi:hypothetical protein [Bacillus massilinigeriensis]|uniref:hypothetical protein n=1 Tax=Bacillus massilionigeriensis TaxID=1805475 RepID=UPI00096AE01D|nr:hypothetical protein [Bacillus massilionigeriensis]
MPPIPEQSAELLRGAAIQWKELLRPENEEDARLVQKGLLLYRQGLVSKVRLENNQITAIVQDVTPVPVVVDLDFVMQSVCSCPADVFCRHQLATFFHVYANVDSVSNWVEEWRQPLREREAASQWGIQKAKDLLKKAGAVKQDYDQWISTFEESFQTIMQGKRHLNPYIIPELFHVYKRRIRAGAPTEQEWKQLYLLIGSVFSFNRLFQLSRELGHSEEEISRYYRHVFLKLADDMEDCINRLHVQALPFAFDPFLERLREDCSLLLASGPELEFERLDNYRMLWTTFFRKREWREQELERLIASQKTEKDNFSLIIGIIHQQILLGLDDDALSLLAKIHTMAAPYLLLWLQILEIQKEWKRMESYIDQLITIIRDYLEDLHDPYACIDFTRMALGVIANYCEESQDMERFEKMLVQTLPFSARNYEYFLIDQRKYQRWSELITYLGFDISSVSSDTVKTIAKEEPIVLLPLYHQSIQKNIDLKNRSNYREAVKQLKKLRTLYRKMKRLEDWESFLAQLLQSTRRLRAFQEECKRSKLIDA